jgi:multidrug transporter EmrE-like cation transporter
VNWTAPALAATIVGLDLGFLLLYRAGFELSLAQIVTQSSAAVLLIGAGVLVFRERLTLANVAGILLCVAGLWLISRR